MEIASTTGHLKSVRHQINDDPAPSEAVISLDLPPVLAIEIEPMDLRAPLDNEARIVGLDTRGLNALVGRRVRLLSRDGVPIRIESAD